MSAVVVVECSAAFPLTHLAFALPVCSGVVWWWPALCLPACLACLPACPPACLPPPLAPAFFFFPTTAFPTCCALPAPAFCLPPCLPVPSQLPYLDLELDMASSPPLILSISDDDYWIMNNGHGLGLFLTFTSTKFIGSLHLSCHLSDGSVGIVISISVQRAVGAGMAAA